MTGNLYIDMFFVFLGWSVFAAMLWDGKRTAWLASLPFIATLGMWLVFS